MTERSAHMGGVVLVGGERELATLEEVARALGGRGMAVTLVDAADEGEIVAAAKRLGPAGVVVLCRGETLVRERVDAVRTLLQERGLPLSRLVTLAIAEGPRALEHRVVAVAQRIAATPEPRRPTPTTIPPIPAEVLAQHRAMNELRAAEADSMPTPGSAMPAELAPAPIDRTLVVRHPSPPPEIAPAFASAPAPVREAAVGERTRRWPLALTAIASIAVIAITIAAIGRGRSSTTDTVPAPTDDAATNAVTNEAASERGEIAAAPKPTTATRGPTTLDRDAGVASESATSSAAAGPAASPPSVEDAPEVVTALRNREVRALDLVVISPEAKKPAAFAGAAAYCSSLVIGELGGWRLPEIGELLSISRAKMVRRGSFWSATKGDTFGDLRLVLVIKRERISPIGVGWNGGRIVCVRERA